jgi:CubicO group peptidase (beta-lactamase class C family)
MNKTIRFIWILFVLFAGLNQLFQPEAFSQIMTAPEIPALQADDISRDKEKLLPDLDALFINPEPEAKEDGIPVGKLGEDGGDRHIVMAFARELGNQTNSMNSANTDSLLIFFKEKLLLEAYYRRGRINYPHYQMSITKSYLSLGIGRAIQCGYLTMDDLHKPVISFLKELDRSKLAQGVESLTLQEAMQMTSGIKLPPGLMKEYGRDRGELKGQRQLQVCFEHCAPLPPAPRPFMYQRPDTWVTMQVLESVVPGTASDFLRKELMKPLGITEFHWPNDYNGLPGSGAGSSFRSRDMLKVGMLVLNRGTWQGKQHIPSDFIAKATTPLVHGYDNLHYGYYWWIEDFDIHGKTCRSIQARGAHGQFIVLFPELDLIVIVTAHEEGRSDLVKHIAQKLVPAFRD